MSPLWKLGKNDYIRGLIVTVVAAALGVVIQALKANGLHFYPGAWEQIITAALVAGLSYLLKNLSTDDFGRLGGRFKVE